MVQYPKSSEVTNLLTFGDWGISKEGNFTKQYLNKNIQNYDAVLFLGDLAYDLDTNNGEVGNTFLTYAMPITSQIPFQLCPGNHELMNNYEHYLNRFYLPSNGIKMYYSYNINNAHILSLNAEAVFDSKVFNKAYIDDMIKWLDDDLSKATARWKIVHMHRPLYCSKVTGQDCNADSEKMRVLLEDIFIKYNVDLVLTSHRHNYERYFTLVI
jgi:hypothetical protein